MAARMALPSVSGLSCRPKGSLLLRTSISSTTSAASSSANPVPCSERDGSNGAAGRCAYCRPCCSSSSSISCCCCSLTSSC